MKRFLSYIIVVLLLCFFSEAAQAQLPGAIRRMGNMGGSRGGGGGGDSLIKRNKFEDSITITFRYLDSARNYMLDSSIQDFTRRYPIPATHVYLGNTGSATRSLLFSTPLRSGFDPGFHAFDVYMWKPEQVRFFNTTRPYTELGYVLAKGGQQTIEVLHTQNIKPYWNASLQYRLINSPGIFRNQKTNHNNYLLTSWYQSPRKRYNNFFILLNNKIQAGESGGIQDTEDFLNDPTYSDRLLIPTKLGGDARIGRNFFNSKIYTGNQYQEFTGLMRQQYDLGKKDSVVTDSTVIPLFYPRLRFELTSKLGKYNYHFRDYANSENSNEPDSAYYMSRYGLAVPASDSIQFTDAWREFSNDFSIYQFPDAKNLHQFFKAGLEYQLLRGEFTKGPKNYYNIIGHGEYRNRTRNQKWDMEAFGRLHLNGLNAGDYHAYISLKRFISQKIGSLQVGFENINRSPSFNYNAQSSFYLDDPSKSFNKENTIHFFGVTQVPKLRLQLRGDYFLVSNYLYLKDFHKLQQESSLFNVLRISASKTFKLSRNWNLHSDVYLQQKAGNAEVNMPLLFTRNRLAFEGNFFRNLHLSTGLEIRYHTPYKGDNYSPVLGQFFYQDSVTLNNLPEVNAFLHFRIRSFKAYARVENLNALSYGNNFMAAPGYPNPGMLMRFGFYWSFIN